MAASASTAEGARALANLSGRILLVGAGKMGSALLEGWLRLGLRPTNIAVLEPQPTREIEALVERGLQLNPPRDALGEIAAVVVAVKPQVAPAALPALIQFLGTATVVVSIMAGRTLRFLEDALPGVAIVRAMPSAVGAVEWIDDEMLMDAVTALSGSGPAYVFLLTEAMAQAGAAAGL